jgi:hypothetical protein
MNGSRRREVFRLVGSGLAWFNLDDASSGQVFGPDPRVQVSTEMFYRWQVTDVFALTPNLQVTFGRIDPHRSAAERSPPTQAAGTQTSLQKKDLLTV